MTPTFRPAQIVEFANGTKIEIPAADYTMRTDLWVDAFDGTYRLFLPLAQATELETKCGGVDGEGVRRPRGVFAIYGAVARGRYELEGRSVGFAAEGIATIAECRETIRLALIGGGAALVDGVETKVDAIRAKQLVENYLVPAAVEQSWDLAYLILHTLIHGRKQRPDEAGTSSRTAVFPRGDDQPQHDEPGEADSAEEPSAPVDEAPGEAAA